MNVLQQLFLALHLLGMAAIVGGWLATRSDLRPIAPIVWGARAQIVTGLLLVGLVQSLEPDEVNNGKIAVKWLVALAVAGCAEMANARYRKDGSSQASLVTAAAGLTVVNVLVATLW